jgi:predicted RND superfamily exporter protein
MLPVEERIKLGLMHSGSSITITSLTNCIAFFLGCYTSLDALKSFCFFCGLGIVFLYLSAITIFTAFMTWDIKRQVEQRGDCCGACCCSERYCCGGSCLTARQRRYPFQGDKPTPVEAGEENFASGTQKFLQTKYAKLVTSDTGIKYILIFYALYIGFSIYGCTQIEVNFKTSYFISDNAYIKQYLDRSEKYYKSGDTINFYTDGVQDFSKQQTQDELNALNNKIINC